MKLKIYLSDDNRKFIEHAAAYVLNIVETRSIMLENDKPYIEINDKKIEYLKNKDNLEIEYVKLEKEKTPKKPLMQIYNDSEFYYIKPSAAYALNLISVGNFYAMQDQLYKVSDNLLVFLRNKYDLEEIQIEKQKSK